MNDTAIDIPGISNSNRASKLMDEMGLGKSGRSVVRQSTQSVKEEVLQKPMLAYEKRFGVGSDERHTLQLDELRAFLEEPAAEEAKRRAEWEEMSKMHSSKHLHGSFFGVPYSLRELMWKVGLSAGCISSVIGFGLEQGYALAEVEPAHHEAAVVHGGAEHHRLLEDHAEHGAATRRVGARRFQRAVAARLGRRRGARRAVSAGWSAFGTLSGDPFRAGGENFA